MSNAVGAHAQKKVLVVAKSPIYYVFLLQAQSKQILILNHRDFNYSPFMFGRGYKMIQTKVEIYSCCKPVSNSKQVNHTFCII